MPRLELKDDILLLLAGRQLATFHLVPKNVVAKMLIKIREDNERQGKTVGGWRNFLTEWVPEHEEDWDALSVPTD